MLCTSEDIYDMRDVWTRMHASGSKVGMIMGPRATNMQASKNILLTKKELPPMCVCGEREENARRDRR